MPTATATLSGLCPSRLTSSKASSRVGKLSRISISRSQSAQPGRRQRGREAQRQGQHDRDQHGQQADQKGLARAIDQPAVEIAADLVGAQPVLGRERRQGIEQVGRQW
jgi:hypothetical protein